MKLNTSIIKKMLLFFAVMVTGFFVIFGEVSCSYALTDDDYIIRSWADIYFYFDDCVSAGGSGTICGSTAREKYWSALGKYFDDPIQKAGIMGSLWQEGQYSPTSWQCGNGMDSSGNFIVPWDTLFDISYSNPTYIGVGGFGITSGLSTYLHWINDNTPNSIQYLKEPTKYAYNWCRCDGDYCGYIGSELKPGDQAMEAMGEAAFDELVEYEVQYAMENFKNATTEEYKNTSFSTPSEAASWWARYWEVGQDYLNPDANRLQEAEKVYDDLKDFSCGSSSSSSSSSTSSSGDISDSKVSSDQITWIGDSGSALAHDEDWNLLVPATFPDADFGPSFNDSNSYVQSCKAVRAKDMCYSLNGANPSGLEILAKIVEEGGLRPYLVFDLGSNGGWDDSMMEELIDLVDGDAKIILIASGSDDDEYYGGINELLRNAAETYDNVYLADMAANYKREYFDDSGIEFSVEGSKVFVQTIIDALNEAANGGCTTYTGDYPVYLQCDERWGSLQYGAEGEYFCNSACGATSMATITTMASGQDVFPTDIADLLAAHRSELGEKEEMKDLYYKNWMKILDAIVCEEYGCEMEAIETSSASEALEKIKQYLEDGWMIHISGTCSSGDHSATCPYSKGGHYVALLALKDEDTAIVSDPGWDGLTEYKLTDIAADTDGAFTAIRGNGSGGGSCENYCKEKDSGAVSGGLTEEQAQKLADYYNSSSVDGSNLPSGKMNCVSFVKWFIEEFTDLTYAGGNGKDVAHNLAVQNDLEEGTEPRPFSVYSVTSIGLTVCEDGYICGHTGIVVAVDGDMITTVEAALNQYDGTVFVTDKSNYTNDQYGDVYTYIEDHVDMEKLNEIVGD